MYFLGDTHGIRPIFTIIDKHKLENQNLIHVGDLGLGFQEITRDVSNLLTLDEMLQETNNKLYVIRGNHDNPIFWDKSKGLWLPKFHNLHLLEDYSVVNIEGKTIFFVGGAVSIDRLPRISEFPPTWWEDEKFKFKWDKIGEIFKNTSKIDIVVTHTAPGFAHPQNDYVPIVDHYCEIEKKHGYDLRAKLREERDLVSKLYDEIKAYNYKPSHWIYGHFHNTKKEIISGIEFKLLNINELYEVK